MADLLPCPFCGKAPKDRSGDDQGGIIGCESDECPRPVVYEATRRKAIARWNTRAPESK